MVPRNNLWNILEELKVPFELRDVAIRLYKNVIAKFKSNEGWSRHIKCNIGVKQGCPLSPTLFGIYIDKLEGCLEEAGCVGMILAGIVIILLLYVDDIVLLERLLFRTLHPYNLGSGVTNLLLDLQTINFYRYKIRIGRYLGLPGL